MNTQANEPKSEAPANVEAPVVEALVVDQAPVVKLVIPELLPREEIKKGQESIRRRLTNLDTDIRANALQCLIHASVHRDTSLMRRLVVDVLDAVDGKNGYRVKGLIAWIRAFSPIELKGKDMNLSGRLTAGGKAALIEKFPGVELEHSMVVGEERPFLIEQAMMTPLWDVSREVALVKPVFRDTLMSGINSAMKNFRNAMDNTDENGKPIDPDKPYFNGVQSEKVVDFFAQVERLQSQLPKDDSKIVFDAEEKLRKAVGGDADTMRSVCERLVAEGRQLA